MKKKIIYWLLPTLAIAFYFLLIMLESEFDFHDPKKIDSSLWILLGLLCLFLPYYLLFIWSYIIGLKIFSLPKPSVKDFIVGIFAAIFAIPLLLFLSLNVPTPPGIDMPTPLLALISILSFPLAGFIFLFFLGLRPPKGKCLFMCFLPALVYAAIGIVLILISGTDFWVDADYFYASVEELSPIQRQLSVLTAKYFTDFYFASYFSFVTSSFTLYWTMKYNRERELAADQGSPLR